MAKGRTQRYYDANPAANRRRLKQQSKYQKTANGRRLKINANKANRKLGTYGNGDNKDAAHTSKGIRLASKKANRSKKGIHA
tara:strand:- start:440 stop:685 length:246 start_codon:yes stop_codon:yes gene_type:complete